MDFNERLQLMDDFCNYYILGKQIYDVCRDNILQSPGTEMIVSPANLGDTVFIATLAKAYKQVHGVEKLIILRKATSGRCG